MASYEIRAKHNGDKLFWGNNSSSRMLILVAQELAPHHEVAVGVDMVVGVVLLAQEQ